MINKTAFQWKVDHLRNCIFSYACISCICSCELDLDLTSLTQKLDLVWRRTCTPQSFYDKACKSWSTNGTERHTDRCDWMHYHTKFAGVDNPGINKPRK